MFDLFLFEALMSVFLANSLTHLLLFVLSSWASPMANTAGFGAPVFSASPEAAAHATSRLTPTGSACLLLAAWSNSAAATHAS